jgi:outer membrane lipase/esterase
MYSSYRSARWLARVFAVVAVLGAGAVQAGELYLFGDSLTDSGNVAIALGGGDPDQIITNYYVPPAPYGSGTFSNGEVWASHVAAKLGLPEGGVPSLLGGDDFAFGGARASIDGSVPSAMTQVGMYLARGYQIRADDLFVIAVGGNDLRDTLAAAGSAPANAATIIGTAAQAYAAAVGTMVDTLRAQGARHILVWNAPNLGLVPAVRFQDMYVAPGTAALATQISGAFNSYLAARLHGVRGVTIFDLFGLLGDIVAHQQRYGFANVTDAAGAVPGIDPDTYLFWDGIHPTAGGHAVLAHAVLAAWPELRDACDGHDRDGRGNGRGDGHNDGRHDDGHSDRDGYRR